MTFKLFNTLNNLFQQGKQIALRIPSEIEDVWDEEDEWTTVATYDENVDIEEISHDIENYPDGKLFIFDGDFYEELED